MKHTAWGLGLAAAGMVLVASHAQASTGTSSSAGDEGTYGGTAGTGMTGSTSMGTSASTAATDPSSTASGHFDALAGKVQKFDRSKDTLTLAGSTKTLKVDPSTKVTKDGSRASIDDIKEGDQVRASFSGAGDTVQVQKLDIRPQGATGTSGMTGSSSSSAPSPGSSRSTSSSSMGTGASGGTSGGTSPSSGSSSSNSR